MSSHKQVRRGNGDSGDWALGTPIGVCSGSNPLEWVRIPSDTRCSSVHIIGVADTGKSTLMEAMILDDVRRGEGVVVLDPYGCMTSRLLCLLPCEAIERTIYFGPGDPDWVPIWNPLHCGPSGDRGRLADGMVRALVNGSQFCRARVEHLLHQVFFALLHLPGGTVHDAVKLLHNRSADSRQLRSTILEIVSNECAVHFWKHEYTSYSRADLAAARLFLSRLLMVDNVGAMLSQSRSSFSFRDVMDAGKILLIDLSRVGAAARDILGGFVLSSLHLTALARGSESEQLHRKLNIYCEEAHRFAADSLEGLLLETRRFGVNLTLSHQSMSQLGTRMVDAVSCVGSTIIFRVNANDAEYLTKDLQGKVRGDDLVTLRIGQAVARIGNRIVRLETMPPLQISERHVRDEIMSRCHQLYCLPSERILRALR